MLTDTKEITIPHDPALAELKRMVDELGSQKAVADKLGISATYMGDMLAGTRDIGPSVLEKIGYMRLIVNVKEDQVALVVSAIDNAIDNALRLERKLLDTARRMKVAK